MALQFFTDHCVPTSAIKRLQDTGHTVFRLRDSIPIDSPDEAVIAHAQQLDAILVSFKGIIALQVRNHPEILPSLMTRLTEYLSKQPLPDHYNGKLFVVEVHRIRIRA